MIRLENIHLEMNNKLLLENESIIIRDECIHVIMGKSGCGKTSLLHEISLLSNFFRESYTSNDMRIDNLIDEEKKNIRRNNIEFRVN